MPKVGRGPGGWASPPGPLPAAPTPSAPSLPALLLLYDITSKMSFDNIRVSAPAPRSSPGIGDTCGFFLGWEVGILSLFCNKHRLFWADPGSSELVPWVRFV